MNAVAEVFRDIDSVYYIETVVHRDKVIYAVTLFCPCDLVLILIAFVNVNRKIEKLSLILLTKI